MSARDGLHPQRPPTCLEQALASAFLPTQRHNLVQ
jgi:hypothetical protein